MARAARRCPFNGQRRLFCRRPWEVSLSPGLTRFGTSCYQGYAVHIAEGVLSASVLGAGAAVAAAGVAIGLRKMDYERVPRVAVLSSAFFVASLIHVPVGPSSAHLVLNGLTGMVLGWTAFPALLVALVLQAVLFGFGGLTVLGVNTVTMGLPAIVCYYLFNPAIIRTNRRACVFGLGFGAGALGIVLGCAMIGVALFASGREFVGVIKLALLAHVPIAVVEGLVTGSVAVFLRKVRPELLEAPFEVPIRKESARA